METRGKVIARRDPFCRHTVCSACYETVDSDDGYCGSCGAKLKISTVDLVVLEVISLLKSIEQIKASVKICEHENVYMNADKEKALSMCREVADAVKAVMEKYSEKT